MLKVCRTPGPTACLKLLQKVCLKRWRKEFAGFIIQICLSELGEGFNIERCMSEYILHEGLKFCCHRDPPAE